MTTVIPGLDRPYLPEPGDTLGPDTVVAATWGTEEPEERGCYTAAVLTIRADHRGYGVVIVAADYGTAEWLRDDEYGYADLLDAVQGYREQAGA